MQEYRFKTLKGMIFLYKVTDPCHIDIYITLHPNGHLNIQELIHAKTGNLPN